MTFTGDEMRMSPRRMRDWVHGSSPPPLPHLLERCTEGSPRESLPLIPIHTPDYYLLSTIE